MRAPEGAGVAGRRAGRQAGSRAGRQQGGQGAQKKGNVCVALFALLCALTARPA